MFVFFMFFLVVSPPCHPLLPLGLCVCPPPPASLSIRHSNTSPFLFIIYLFIYSCNSGCHGSRAESGCLAPTAAIRQQIFRSFLHTSAAPPTNGARVGCLFLLNNDLMNRERGGEREKEGGHHRGADRNGGPIYIAIRPAFFHPSLQAIHHGCQKQHALNQRPY